MVHWMPDEGGSFPSIASHGWLVHHARRLFDSPPGRMLRLALADISKQYPAVKANDRVSLRVAAGEIHAVLGENGAGKSTLMKIIYGAVRPDEGEIRWNGEKVEIASPAAAP
jgi:ABC-type sugar transport system ATPase subunit